MKNENKLRLGYFVPILLSLFLWSSFAYAQKKISGKVTDSEGSGALPGVTVLVKGTQTGTATDADGSYSISLPAGSEDVLIFSFVGYKSQEIIVGNQTTINVSLVAGASYLDEVVVVAYGEQKKATVTGAVASVQGDKIMASPAVDLSNSLAGRLPGLVVVQTSGEPGQDGARISIRGTNTLGNSSPLVVIDGIPDRDGGLGRLNPRDIESISVLKDASAAIYGARAANGAIIVTTKRGKTGKTTVTYDFNQGWSQPTIVPKMSNATEYANIMNELPIYKTIPVNEWGAAWQSIKTTGGYKSPTAGVKELSANYSPEAVRKHTDGSDPWRYPDTDWFAGSFRTLAPQSRHNLQLSGGSENIRYMASVGYVFQDAIYKNSATKYQQYNFRVNVDAKINDYISANLGVMARREDRRYPTENSGAIFRMLMRGRPTEPQVWPNGLAGPDIENGQNPYVITTNATGYEQNFTDYIQTNGGVTITNPWIKGLKLSLTAAVDKRNDNNKTWQTPWKLYSWDKTTFEADGITPLLVGSIRSTFTDPRLSQGTGNALNTNLTGILTYETKFGANHSLNIMAGVTKETFKGDFFFAYRRNFISPAVDQLFAGGALLQNNGGSAYNRARLGYYGRVQYSYKDKYLVELVNRYDGSYIFPTSGRFGFFPGVSVGWNITSEDWFKVSGIDYLKIRGSYGQMGNDQVSFDRNGNGVVDPGELQEYAFLSSYSFGQYPINGELTNTLRETILANPSFTWERANNYNVGLDGTLFKNRIDFTLEYFYNRRSQILIQQTGSTPASSGISALLPPVNAGIVDNKGFEFTVGYNGKAFGDLQFRVGINGGYARNKVVFMDEIPGAPAWQRQEGKPIGAFLTYQSDGAFLNQSEVDANKLDYSAVTSKLLPGDMKFVDYNSDGKINADDQVRMNKNQTPTFNFGATIDLRYKGFDLNILFQGATGAALRIQTESGDIGNFLKFSHDNRWSVDSPSSTDPRLASRGDTYYTGGNFGNNTYFLFSKNYIRLKNIELGYSLPATVVQKVKLSNVRLFVNGLNLFTIAANNVFDPEANASGGVSYPLSRVLNTGLTVTF